MSQVFCRISLNISKYISNRASHLQVALLTVDDLLELARRSVADEIAGDFNLREGMHGEDGLIRV